MNPYEHLCIKDPRNPLHAEIAWHDEDDPVIPRKGCFCDACFTGKDALALEIIRQNNFLSSVVSQLDSLIDEVKK